MGRAGRGQKGVDPVHHQGFQSVKVNVFFNLNIMYLSVQFEVNFTVSMKTIEGFETTAMRHGKQALHLAGEEGEGDISVFPSLTQCGMDSYGEAYFCQAQRVQYHFEVLY